MEEKRKTRKRPNPSAALSVVSMKSEASMYEPMAFGLKETQRQLPGEASESTAPDVVSMKSDASMYEPMAFGLKETQGQLTGEPSTAPSVVSMKSSASMYEPMAFGREGEQSKPTGKAPSVVSMKSSASMYEPMAFGREEEQSRELTGAPSESTASGVVPVRHAASMYEPMAFGLEETQHKPTGKAPSVVSMKSRASMYEPMAFGVKETQSHRDGELPSCSVCQEVLRDPVHLSCGHLSCKQCLSSDQDQRDLPAHFLCKTCGKKFRRDPDTEEDPRMRHLLRTKEDHKEAMQKKFAWTSEGNGDQGSSLNKIYSELIITTGEDEGPHEERGFRNIKHKLDPRSSDQLILSEIFTPLPGEKTPHRIVLTKGIAGIGKSFTVQKFVLDWAEEKESHSIDFVFCLAFREVNLCTGNKSLYELLADFHPALKSLKDTEDLVHARVMVILDGLDESRLQLDFKNKPVTSVSEVTSVGNLLANLIQGNLLPEANLWITSRPAAASQIPAGLVSMVTEIRGFSDPQKEEYFKKRFSQDLSLADRIISHIRSSQSLDIMCQIPIFCWISAVLFQEVFGEDEKAEIPQTLTEMMAHFVFAQTKRRSRKYDKKAKKKEERLLKTHREFLLKLGKLAFVHLQKNNLIFYDEDLEACGIDIDEATIYSGFCTAILREEDVFSQKKVFYFVHLTIQEFFAALFVYDCFTNKNTEELDNFLNLKNKELALLGLLKMTVDKVLEKKHGHLDFFLRFLLGLTVEHNQRFLQDLLTPPDPSQDTDKKILTYLRALRRKTLSPDSCINLFQAMVEMRDHKVKDEIQEYLKLSDPSKAELTPLHCSALAYMLQVSKNDLDELDLKSYNTSDEGRRRLIPAVRSSRAAILAGCKVTEEWVKQLAFGLRFPYVPLRNLDLSNNDLKDSGVKRLCKGLSSKFCRLEILRLSGCMITEEGCGSLVLALESNPLHLKELDLSYNNPGDSGKNLLSKLKEDPQYKLSELNVDHDGIQRIKPGLKKYACELTLDPNTAHKNLLLSDGNRKVTWVEEEQPYPPHHERFDLCQQVLCEQGLDGRCYWEVEVSEPFCVGLTYRTIGRKGDVNSYKLGRNNKSWCLICSESGCFVQHCNKSVSVAHLCSRSSRVAVYLDWPAGTLSFYRGSSDSWICVHTYKERFTEPLFPAFQLSSPSSALLRQ